MKAYLAFIYTLLVLIGFTSCMNESSSLKDAVSALASSSSLSSNNKRQDQLGKCQEITVPMCRNMPYNMTSMPNQFNHYTQQEAAMEAHQFWALVEINCSNDLRFFLCSMYTPICIPNYTQQVKACKSVCVRARLGCEKYMKKFGFDWPEHMNCDLFPEYGTSKDVCMDPIDATQQTANKKLTLNHNLNANSKKQSTLVKNSKKLSSPATTVTSNLNVSPIEKLNDILCQSPFTKSVNNEEKNINNVGYLTNCVQSCTKSTTNINQNIYFTEWQQTFTYYWLMIWTILCMFSSLCTTFSYLIEPNRFKYPEKPIIYLSICYLFVSFGYLLRYIFGQDQMSLCYAQTNLPCILTFVFIYYFGMASSVWWVIVSLTWFLAAGLKWGCESISKYVKYFHLFAWLLPLIKTCIILSLSYVDNDTLTGICYVGNLSVNNLRIFVLIPSLIYLTLGITFLIAGFISLIRIRNIIKRQNHDLNKANKLEKLMIRIGIFSILYTVPATCVLACQFYEQYYRNDWEKNLMCRNHFNKMNIYTSIQQNSNNEETTKLNNMIKTFCSSSSNTFVLNDQQPDFNIFMLKYFMSLIVGVTSGFWIWSNKTVKSWNFFFDKLTSCCYHDKENNIDNNKNSSLHDEDIDESASMNKNNYEPSKRFCCNILSNKSSAKRDSIVYFQQPQNDTNHLNNLFHDDKQQQHQSQNDLFLSNYNNIAQQQQQQPQQIYSTNNLMNQHVQQLNNQNKTYSSTIAQQQHQQQYFPLNYDQQALLKLHQNNNINNNAMTNKAGYYYDFCSSSALSAATSATRNNTTTGTYSSKYSVPSTAGYSKNENL